MHPWDFIGLFTS